MRAQHVFHPDFAAESFWQAAPPTDARPPPDLPASTDVVVVGAGHAGLNAALELAAGGRETCVVDAGAFGVGTTALDAGALAGGGSLLGAAGGAAEPAVFDEAVRALGFLERLIELHGIDCGYQRCGHFVGACAPGHLERLRAWADATPGELELIPATRQWEETGSAYYLGGLRVRRAAKLEPVRYARGLLDACRRLSVTLCGHTEVRAVTGSPGAWRVRTSRGELRTRDVILTTSGDSGPASPPLRERLVPVARHMITTEPVPLELAEALFPGGRTLSETARLGHQGRLAPDGQRVLFGGYACLRALGPREAALHLHRRLLERFPHLRGVRLTHAWSGAIDLTRDRLPHAGRTDGLYYCAGGEGGSALLSYLGYVVAREVAGAPVESALWNRAFPPIPVLGYRGKPWFLPLAGGYLQTRDWLDRRARPPR